MAISGTSRRASDAGDPLKADDHLRGMFLPQPVLCLVVKPKVAFDGRQQPDHLLLTDLHAPADALEGTDRLLRRRDQIGPAKEQAR